MSSIELLHRTVTAAYVDDLERQIRQMREVMGAASLQNPSLVAEAVTRHLKEHTSHRLAALERTVDLTLVVIEEIAQDLADQKLDSLGAVESLNKVCTELLSLRNQVNPNKPMEQ